MKTFFRTASAAIKSDPSWAFFLTFSFLCCVSMPLARIALVLSLWFSLSGAGRRGAFRFTPPTLGWVIYLALALVASGIAWACLEDPMLEPARGFRKIAKLLWYAAIPLGVAQVDSRSRLVAALRAFVAGAATCAALVMLRNPILAQFQMVFPTDAQAAAGVASGAVSPLGAWLHSTISSLGRLDAVNKWIYSCGRAQTWSQAFVKLGTMQDSQRLMVAMPAALGLLMEEVRAARRLRASGHEAVAARAAARRRRTAFVLVLVAAGLVATCKRGPLLAGAIVAFALLLSRIRWWKAALLVSLLVAAVAALPQARARFAQLPDELELRRGGRALMWTRVVPELHREHPWGIGFRSLTWEKMFSIDKHVELNQNHVHCTPLQAFVDFSWLGLAAWTAWMALAFASAAGLARLSRRPEPGSSLPETSCFAVPLAMLAALFFYGLVEYNLADSEVVLLYGFAMGLTGPSLMHSAPTPTSAADVARDAGKSRQ